MSNDEVGSELTLEWLAAVFQSGRSREALINTVDLHGRLVHPGDGGRRRALRSCRRAPTCPGGRLVGGAGARADPGAALHSRRGLGGAGGSERRAHQHRRLGGSPGPRTVAVNINTMLGIIWITGLFLTPYVYLLVAAGFANSDPAVEEAARVSGAGPDASALHDRPAAAAAGAARCPSARRHHERRRLHHPVDRRAQGAHLPAADPDLAELTALPGAPRASRPRNRCCWSIVGLVCIYFQRRALSRGGRYTIVGGKGVERDDLPLGRLALSAVRARRSCSLSARP